MKEMLSLEIGAFSFCHLGWQDRWNGGENACDDISSWAS